MNFLSYIFGGQPTYADLAKMNPKLLSGEWSFCAHKKGFWGEDINAPETVTDETGRYTKLTGECKSCQKKVVAYRALE